MYQYKKTHNLHIYWKFQNIQEYRKVLEAPREKKTVRPKRGKNQVSITVLLTTLDVRRNNRFIVLRENNVVPKVHTQRSYASGIMDK